ncbi:MAG: hypothetical protein ACR2OW_03365 [Methyloligellaceae bacterium]
MSKLVLTNGDSAASLLEVAGCEGEIVPWRDVLHAGPVPLTPDDDALVDIRAAFLADGHLLSVETVAADMRERNSLLDSHNKFETIELWFEHDLYDQLQLVQILDMLRSRDRFENLVLVQAPDYLGTQTAETIMRFEELALLVNETMMATASAIWNHFRHETPERLADKENRNTPGFLFLRQALERILEELPGPDGLSRTERQILYSINRNIHQPGFLFARDMNMEEAAFLGDTGFFTILSDLEFCRTPLIEGLSEPFELEILSDDERRKAFIGGKVALTAEGKAVLDGDLDHLQINEINRWLGGTHLKQGSLWRWDETSAVLTGPE